MTRHTANANKPQLYVLTAGDSIDKTAVLKGQDARTLRPNRQLSLENGPPPE